MLSANGGEFRSATSPPRRSARDAPHARRAGCGRRPTATSRPCNRTILDECWRPAFARYLHLRFTGLSRELETYLDFFNFDRVHHGRLTRGSIPGELVDGARKMEAR